MEYGQRIRCVNYGKMSPRHYLKPHERGLAWYRWIGEHEYLFVAVMFVKRKTAKAIVGNAGCDTVLVEEPRVLVFKGDPREKYLTWHHIKTLPLVRTHKFKIRGNGIID